jgi:S1-C subfamily serine protease
MISRTTVRTFCSRPESPTGAGYGQVTAIVHYDGHNADVVWNYSGNGGAVTVIGAAPRPRVALTDEWNTSPDLRDAPVRSFRFVIAKAKIGFTETYATVSDNPPWLGVFVTVRPGDSTSADVVVNSLVAGSPAAGVLQRGDIITSISGPPLKFAHALIGPPLIDELATHKPGDTAVIDLVRDGIPMTVRVRVSSLPNPLAVNAIFPSVPASAIEDMP